MLKFVLWKIRFTYAYFQRYEPLKRSTRVRENREVEQLFGGPSIVASTNEGNLRL